MWHRFWQDRFFKITLWLIILMGPANLYALENIPGLLSSLLDIQKSHNNQFDVYFKTLEKNELQSEFLRAREIRLDPFFMQSLLFYSDDLYLQIVKEDPCIIYSLIENDLLKTREGSIKHIGVVFKTKDGRQISALIEKNTFLNYVYDKECTNQKDLSVLYSKKNFHKTFKKITFERPKDYHSCLDKFNQGIRSPNLPYLCKIPKEIHEGNIAEKILSKIGTNQDKKIIALTKMIREKNFYLKNTNLFEQNYLESLCQNISDPEKFCTYFQADDAWSKIKFGDLPTYKLDYLCAKYLKIKKVPTKEQLLICADKFIEKPQTCSFKDSNYSFFPLNYCDTLSKSLKISNLKTPYNDCPSKIDNDTVTNLYRIFKHFHDKAEPITEINTCVNKSYREAMDILSEDDPDYSSWPLKICYTDPKVFGETCLPYIPGKGDIRSRSETRVINQILQRTKGASPKEECTIVSTQSYNPVRLDHRYGCIIVIDPNVCSSYYCPRKIFYKKAELKNITYTGKATLNYFRNSPEKSFNSMVDVLKRKLKIKYTELRSLSAVLAFFKKTESGIAHGIGCLEDLYPHLFRKDALNQCRPLPFLIDGIYRDENKKPWINIRTAIDNVQSPHLIHWNFIFSAVKNYEEIHPLKTWTLNGISK